MNSKVYIETAFEGGKTLLKQSYFSPPFKLANITERNSNGTLQLVLMSSSPGVLDGDEYSIEIEIAARASLQLHTQSYQRIFQMKGQAVQTMTVNMASGSSFLYLPHPSVPHHASSFFCHNKIFLSQANTLLWGEVLTCGRKLNGEVFKLSKYQSITEIFLENRLVVKENLLIQAALIDPLPLGQMEGFSHQASLLLINETLDGLAATSAISDMLKNETEIEFGISRLPINGVVVRILGHKAEQLYNCLQAINLLYEQH